MDLSNGMTMETFLTVGITLVTITASIVAIRLIANFRFIGRLYADDCKLIFSIQKKKEFAQRRE